MKQQRDYYFDNGKFLLIFFVVFGHFIRSFIENNEPLLALYKTIYAFHMPAFILVSGHFAKGYFKKGYIFNLMKKLLIPYIIFQVIYTIYYYFLYNQKHFSIDLFQPQWSLWFLISLFCWHLMLPFFTKMKTPMNLMISLAIGLIVGYFDFINSYLSLSRTFVFFPFFLLGYYLKKEHFIKLRGLQFRIPATGIMMMVFIFFYAYPSLDFEWLFGSKPYSQLDINLPFAWIEQLFIYGLSFITVLSFWSLVPEQKYFFTKIGKYTLYVYLLHGFIIRYFRVSQFKQWFNDNERVILLAFIALIITFVLSSKFVRRLVQPIIELNMMHWQNVTKQLANRRMLLK